MKRKKQQNKNDIQLSYRLQFVDENFNFKDITDADFDKFRELHPQVAEMIINPSLMYEVPAFKEKIRLENWQNSAMQLVSAIWKIKNANIFYSPVDPVKLGIHDYFEIIKHPMDFGTIKVNL